MALGRKVVVEGGGGGCWIRFHIPACVPRPSAPSKASPPPLHPTTLTNSGDRMAEQERKTFTPFLISSTSGLNLVCSRKACLLNRVTDLLLLQDRFRMVFKVGRKVSDLLVLLCLQVLLDLLDFIFFIVLVSVHLCGCAVVT